MQINQRIFKSFTRHRPLFPSNLLMQIFNKDYCRVHAKDRKNRKIEMKKEEYDDDYVLKSKRKEPYPHPYFTRHISESIG